MTVLDVATAIRSFRFLYTSEDDLQLAIAEALTGRGFNVEREVRLNRADRIDLMVDRVGVEVKVAGAARTNVVRQVARYTTSDLIDGIVLVTSRVRHDLPAMVNGKPVAVVQIAGSGF